MKKITFYILNFIFFIFIIGCASKTTPIFVTIKSPKIKISDSGFLKENVGYKEIIIYKAGSVPVKFILKKDKICVNNQCFNKYLFVKRYFNGYEKDFFDKILDKQPLKKGELKKISNGFIQKSNNFIYIVKKDSIFFKDKSKNIIIYVKYLKEKE